MVNNEVQGGGAGGHHWPILFFLFLPYLAAHVIHAGLLRDQRYRTDPDAGMPIPD